MSENEISIDDNADEPSNLINKEMKTYELGDNSDSNAKDIKQIENNVNINPNANIENSENNEQNNNINSKEINENQNDNNLNNNNIINDFDIEAFKMNFNENGLIILNTQKPSLGLQNIGATCYMNSTLQCLIHIKELSEALLSSSINSKEFILTSEYVNILKHVFFPKSESQCFAPYKFKELVGELKSDFRGISANDAKDLLQFVVEKMHSEVKIAEKQFSDYNFDQSNELQTIQYFYDEYISQNYSPFLKYLYGIIKIQTKCLNCQTVQYNFQSYNLLYFPLKESKIYAIAKKKKKIKISMKKIIF